MESEAKAVILKVLDDVEEWIREKEGVNDKELVLKELNEIREKVTILLNNGLINT